MSKKTLFAALVSGLALALAGCESGDGAVPATAPGQTVAPRPAPSFGFRAAQAFGLSNQSAPGPQDAVFADVNGDSIVDALVSNDLDGTVSVFLGSGQRSFGAPRAFATGLSAGGGVHPIATASLSANGHLDLVVGDPTSGRVAVLQGNGDGTFETPGAPTVVTGATAVTGLGAGNFVSPSQTDVLVSDAGGSVFLLRANGSGGFSNASSPESLATGQVPGPVAVGRLTSLTSPGQTAVTAAVALTNGSVLLVQQGAGSSLATQTLNVGHGAVVDVTWADLDQRDGLDVACLNADNSISVFLNQGGNSLTFAGTPETVVIPGAHILVGIAAGTLNDDAYPDLVVTDREQQQVDVVLNRTGTAPFAGSPSIQAFSTGAGNAALAVVNTHGLDDPGNGALDVVTVNSYNQDQTVSILLGNGDGTLQSALQTTVVVAGTPIDPRQPLAVEGDGDARTDLLVLDGTFQQAVLLPGQGDGTFGTPLALPGPGGIPIQGVAGDFGTHRGARRQDLAVVYQTNADPPILRVYLNSDQGLNPASFVDTTLAASGTVYQLVSADFNHDGRADVALSLGGSTVAVFLGSGAAGAFGPESDHVVSGFSTCLAAGDFTGDGLADLALQQNPGQQNTLTLVNDGTGSFAQTLSSAGAPFLWNFPTQTVAADVDGDGLLDLVSFDLDQRRDNLMVQLGYGDGTFHPPVNVPMARATSQTQAQPEEGLNGVQARDLDGDGLPELVVTTFSKVDVFRNTSTPGQVRFAAPLLYAAHFFPEYSVSALSVSPSTIADWNGDAKPDIVQVNLLSHDLSTLLQR